MNENVLRENFSLIRKYTGMVKKYSDGISFAIGEPCVDVKENIVNKTIEALQNKKYKYDNAQGNDELISEICIKEKVNKENILVTNGASEAIFITLLTILNKGDQVIVINPSYSQYAPVINFCGGEVVYLDTFDTNYVPSYAKLINLISDKTKAIIVNNPSNPTGVIYDNSTLQMINDVAIKYNLFILCDDVYENLCYIDRKPFSFSNNNTAYFKSFSKTYAMTGFRLGYVISSEKLIKNLLKVHSYTTISIPTFVQKAGVEALRSSGIKKEVFYKNLEIMYEFLNEENIDYIEVDGGIFIFVNITQFDITSTTFCDELLERYHVACVPGICFNDDNFIRINFAVKRVDLYKGIERIRSYIKELRDEKMDFS